MDKAEYREGDWVRFQHDGRLVVGVVQYVRQGDTYPYRWEYVTDRGTVSEGSVLEGRSGGR